MGQQVGLSVASNEYTCKESLTGKNGIPELTLRLFLS